jgi:plastocyanin
MNKLLLVGVLGALLLIVGGLWVAMQQAPAQIEETIAPEEEMEEEVQEPASETGEVHEFTVMGTPFQFSVTEMRVKQGDTVRITFINGQGIHDWRIDELGAATAVLQQGQQETIEFVANQTGEFEYYCSVNNHRELGMVGTLIVEE